MKRILPISAFLLVLAIPTTFAKSFPDAVFSVRALAWTEQATDDEGEPTGEAVVSNHCTTFSVSQDKHLFMTAAHCIMLDNGTSWRTQQFLLQDLTNPKLYFEVHPIAIDLTHDLAMLKSNPLGVKPIELAKDDVDYGDEVLTAGFPFGWSTPAAHWGLIAVPSMSEDKRLWMVYNLACAPGCSGSPVMNKHNKLVSVLQCGWGRSFSTETCGSTWADTVAFAKRWIAAAK